MILAMATLQLVVCTGCAIYGGIWLGANQKAWYLTKQNPSEGGFTKFFTWFIIFAQFIPISLLVSMEMVKYAQAHFMQWDVNMYKHMPGGIDNFCNVQNSNLNEDLGQIEYVFSDKTGTLTENSLDFRKCVIGAHSYGRGETEISRAAKLREKAENQLPDQSTNRIYSIGPEDAERRVNNFPHVNFDEVDLLKSALQKSEIDPFDEQAQTVRQFLTVLALNNSCFPVTTNSGEDDEKRELRAASPDDECLTYFAEFAGIQLTERNHPKIVITLQNGPTLQDVVKENFELLAEFEFTSKRKRMSVILRNRQTGKVHFTMKGADNEMFRLIPNVEEHRNYRISKDRMEQFSEEGLRTLVIGQRIFEPEWWDQDLVYRFREFRDATMVEGPNEEGHIKGSCSDECAKCMFYEDVEFNAQCDLLGITAIEDKLQDAVPETIRAMLDGGIKVWVLTGDKQKTAENIGIASNLLEPEMFRNGLLFRLIDPLALHGQIDEAMQTIQQTLIDTGKCTCGLVVNSKVIAAIMGSDRELLEMFLQLARACKSVIGVRLQPNQKAQIVQMIKSELKVITLAVGDGANDEPMIRMGNVGVGIAGVEGTAAVRASDYAIAQFRFLRRLIFVHGQLHYRRISILICYIFYKNGLLSLSSFWFGFFSGMSGQIAYLEWAYQLYNVGFTAFPILLFGVIDKDHEERELETKPEIYSENAGGKLFNSRIFMAWIIDAFVESCILAMFPLLAFANLTTADTTGQSFGIWSYGVVAYTCIVLAANLRLAMITKSWTIWTHFLLWLSLSGYLISMLVLNSTTFFANAGSDYYWIVFRLLGNSRFWLTVAVSTTFALLVPFTFTSYQELIQVTEEPKVQSIVPLTKAISRSGLFVNAVDHIQRENHNGENENQRI